MLNLNCKNNFVWDCLIKDKPKVCVLEDAAIVQAVIKEIIEETLDWQVIVVENREEAIRLCEEKQVAFYILDIHLGKTRTQEGLDTAEILKVIDKQTFVSIFTGYPNPQWKKMAKMIGVDLFEEKGNSLKEGASRIALEMLLYQDNIINSILQDCLTKMSSDSSRLFDNLEIKELFDKKKEISQKLEDILKLERSYRQDNPSSPDLEKLREVYIDEDIEEDVNINAYEKLKKDKDWFKKCQDKYVAFIDGEWLEDYISDNANDLLTSLRNSKEYKDKSIFYIQVQEVQQDDSIMELPMSLLF